MSRYIDADEVKKRMIPLSFSVQKWLSEVDLELVPTADVVEVVRCKDCIYWTTNISSVKLRDNFCNRDEAGCFYSCYAEDYCNFGERRKDDAVH